MAAVSSYAQTDNADVFHRFKHRIMPREVKNTKQTEQDRVMSRGERELRKMLAEQEKSQKPDTSLFVEWSKTDVIAVNKANREASAKEKLDSIVRKNILGQRVSKQTFTYTKEGWRLHCNNYVPDEMTGEWKLYGYYDYVYDDLGRTIESSIVDESAGGESAKYEFFYSDESPYYTSQIYSTYENGEWVPAQKADYVYDERYNTIEEVYSLYTFDAADWTPVERKTATFDAADRVTSYYEYVWDEASNDWVGRPYSLLSQTFTYDGEGRDLLTSYYTWENGKWLEYERDAYTYDGNGNMLKLETSFWNRDRQDWSGADDYSDSWGTATRYNRRLEYTYDDKDRVTSLSNYAMDGAGKWTNDLNETYEYEDLEDGTYRSTRITYKPLREAGVLEPNTKSERIMNKYGSTLYSKSWRINSDYTDFVPEDEAEMYVDEYDNYFGSTSYRFMVNEDGTVTRYGTLREIFTFADDWDPASRLNNPETYVIQQGSYESDDTFTDYQMYEYSWVEGTDIIAGYNNYQFVRGNKTPIATWVTEYDPDKTTEDFYSWPIATQIDAMNIYKVLATHNYQNWSYITGSTDWTPDSSYDDAYYYSGVTPSGIGRLETTAEGAREVARYNLSGQRVDKSAEGIMIIKYDDGSTKKVINK